MLFNIGFLSQRAGSDSEPGRVRWGEWGGWSVGNRNLDSDVFREAFVCTPKDVLKNTASSTSIKEGLQRAWMGG